MVMLFIILSIIIIFCIFSYLFFLAVFHFFWYVWMLQVDQNGFAGVILFICRMVVVSNKSSERKLTNRQTDIQSVSRTAVIGPLNGNDRQTVSCDNCYKPSQWKLTDGHLVSLWLCTTKPF